MRTLIEQKLLDKFVQILMKHSNGTWATRELDYLVFVEHIDDFNNLSESEQWEVRHMFLGLKQIYGE